MDSYKLTLIVTEGISNEIIRLDGLQDRAGVYLKMMERYGDAVGNDLIPRAVKVSAIAEDSERILQEEAALEKIIRLDDIKILLDHAYDALYKKGLIKCPGCGCKMLNLSDSFVCFNCNRII